MLLLALAIAFILGVSIGAGSQGEIKFISDTLSSWVAALATVCIAILTIILAKETWELRELQTRQIEQIRKASIKPSIDVSLKSSPAGLNFIDIHINNNGVGVARNIEFQIKNSNPNAADVYGYVEGKMGNLAMLSKGLSSLAAGDSRISFLFNAIKIAREYENKFDYKAEVEATYEDIEGTEYKSHSSLAFGEFEGRSLPDEALHKISQTLEKIESSINERS